MSTVRQRIKYIVSDYLTANVGWLSFNIVRYFSLPRVGAYATIDQWLFHYPSVLLGQLLIPLMMVGLYALSGFYNNVRAKSRLDETGNTAIVSLTGMLIIFFTTLINDEVPERLHNYELMAILWLLLFGPTVIGRALITTARNRARARGVGLYRALIVGDRQSAERLEGRLAKSRRAGDFIIAGTADPATDDISEAIARIQPRVIIVSDDTGRMELDMTLISKLLRTGLDIYVPVSMYRLMASNPRMTSVASEPLINITTANIPPSTVNLKRVGDVAVSALALVCLLPVFAVVAMAIRLDSPGPILYRQERVGYRKRRFRIIKFRTMRTDAEAAGPSLSSANDPRVTRVGRFLRKYRIDELPQFWNVLTGDMSIVGPRPEREYFVRQIVEREPRYSLIHQVRPGITSWGMVKYGYAGSVDEMIERLRYDLIYLENVSLGVDLKILFYTVHTVLTGKGV